MKTTKGLKSVCFLLFLTLPLLAGASELFYPVLPLAKEPVLDGRIKGDPAWEGVPFATDFFRISSNVYASKQTSFGVGYFPGKALYIGFICNEPEVKNLKTLFKDGDIRIWTEDGIEIFLFPQGGDNYYHFMVNADGFRWNGKEAGSPDFPLWNWKTKIYRGEDFYSIEVKIPFDVLGRTPKPNETWRGNFCRNIVTGFPPDRFTRWGKGDFLNPEYFVALTFGRKILEEEIMKFPNKIYKSQREEILPHLELERWKKIEKKMVNLDKLPPLELWKLYEQLLSKSDSVENLRTEFLRSVENLRTEFLRSVENLRTEFLRQSFFTE